MHSIAITHALKRAAMQTLFTHGLRGEAQKETEIGPVPESWDIRAIDDVAVSTLYGLSMRGRASGAYPILRMNCQEDRKGTQPTEIFSSSILTRKAITGSG